MPNDRTEQLRHGATAFVLHDDDEGEIRVIGERIAFGSSRSPTGRAAKRWSEIGIYRNAGGGYVVNEIGQSAVPGERPRSRVRAAADGRGIHDALAARTGRVTIFAAEILADAARHDEQFARSLGDVLDVEDLSASPYAPDAMLFTLPRDGDRALRFAGRRLGSGSSRTPDSRSWTECAIYRSLDDQLVASKEQRSLGDAEPVKARVAVVTDARSVVRALSRPGVGWVESALLDALDEARARDPGIAAEISGGTARWAHEILGAARVIAGDFRHRALVELRRGARIVAHDRAEGGVESVQWFGASEAAPKLHVPGFLTLSRQRLIATVLDAQTPPGVSVWRISPKGLDVLREAGESGSETR